MKSLTKSVTAVALVALLAVAFAVPVMAAPEPGDDAQYIGLGSHGMWINTDEYGSDDVWSGHLTILLVDKAETYDAYCLDYFSPLAEGDYLEVDGLLTAEEWCQVNWVLHNFVAEDAADPDLEAAAIQAVIWMITSGDDDLGIVPVDVSDRADEIFGLVPTEDCSFPVSIELTPESQTIPLGECAMVTATVHDNNGMPFEGAEVSIYVEGCHDWTDTRTTDECGEVSVEVCCCEGGCSVSILAEVKAGYGRLVEHVLSEGQDVVLLPGTESDTATVRCECYFPDGHTPGFWKNNAKKYLDWKLCGKKYVGVQVHYSDYLDYLNSITSKYGGDFSFLSFTGSDVQKMTKAYNILNYGGSDPMLKAQKHMLSALLTVEWYDDVDEGWYEGGCVRLPCGTIVNIGEAIEDMLEAYDAGMFAKAHYIAEALNEQHS